MQVTPLSLKNSTKEFPGKIFQQRSRCISNDPVLKIFTVLDRIGTYIGYNLRSSYSLRLWYTWQLPEKITIRNYNVFLSNVPLIHPRGDIRIRIRDTPARPLLGPLWSGANRTVRALINDCQTMILMLLSGPGNAMNSSVVYCIAFASWTLKYIELRCISKI